MKRKNWKYLAIVLSVIGLLLIAVPLIATPNVISGERTSNLDIGLKNVKTAKLVPTLIKTTINDNQLDQLQDQIGSTVDGVVVGPTWMCQGVENDRTPIYGFSIIVSEDRETGAPEGPMYFGIISSKYTGDDLYDLSNWEAACILNPGVLPQTGTPYWITVEFDSPLPLYIAAPTPVPTKFYIVALSEDNAMDGNWFVWHCSGNLGDVYSRGHVWQHYEGSWYDFPGAGDMTFATFTTETTPPNPPVITIQSSSWVVASQATGILSLFGAVICGSKWLMLGL